MTNVAVKLGELMKLSYTVSQLTEHPVFVSYAGHCNVISLHVGESKENYSTRIFDDDLYMDVWPEEFDETIDRWMTYLNELLEVKAYE